MGVKALQKERLTERGVSTRWEQHTCYAVHYAVCSLSSVNLPRASPHLEAPVLLYGFPQISFNTFKIQAKDANEKTEEEKNQINPPSTAGRARKKGPSFSSDPVSTRRTEIERRGGERNGHLSLSLSPSCGSWELVFGAEEMDGMGGRTLPPSAAASQD